MTKLFRVYTHTLGDESITERLVAADSKKEAEANALDNVKAQNLGKGNTSQASSKGNTTVLSSRECGKHGVLATNRIPVASLALMASSLFATEHAALNSTVLKDFQSDMRNLAGMPEDASLEEVTTVLTAMLSAEAEQEPACQ